MTCEEIVVFDLNLKLSETKKKVNLTKNKNEICWGREEGCWNKNVLSRDELGSIDDERKKWLEV